ncbi:jg2777 [Pararge aegeria aegeria]|uniref:Jg2777 protein n=2 Tax=Pararge aegeria TaxID=116150 RepID=A0A8S4QS77_9NEOP|nr:jg2777 [Pararge aegeria aegeria]
MKRLANFKKYIGKNMKHERDEESVEIKFEPNVQSSNLDMDKDNEDYNDMDNDVDNEDFPEMNIDTNIQNDDNSDPLCMVLNGDSGIESISHSGSYSQFDSKEVVKLKLELLKYQLETAKLERQRIKAAYDAENSERKSKSIEASLRLRAARLDAVASESKLPSTHTALQYSDKEKLAEQYMRQFENTCNINKSGSDID